MQFPLRPCLVVVVCSFLSSIGLAAASPQAVTPALETATAPLPRADANGNPLRRSQSGHVTNYDEAKAGDYTRGLPDPLVLANGQPVREAETWLKQRRPEILRLYETEIYGRVPASVPKASFEAFDADPGELKGSATRKNIVIRFGNRATSPKFNVTLYLPANATGPVPVLMHATFSGQLPGQPALSSDGKTERPSEIGPIREILARGYGYALYRYTEIQLDAAKTGQSGLQAEAYTSGQTAPLPDEWGTIGVWAWAASRVLDYFETDRAIDAKRVALIGHSRVGKMALWAGASDPRFALVFASCSGEMGASLSRRDYGETIDDVAPGFPWWFAANFQRYIGRWRELPVDAHMLIALNAPHPVFITGGTQDQWADPTGEYLAAVEAGPVYQLLGKTGISRPQLLPPLDTPLTEGDVGFYYHTGGHAITPNDWNVFLAFADKHLRPSR